MHRTVIALSSLVLLACGGGEFTTEAPISEPSPVADAGAATSVTDAGPVVVEAASPHHEVAPKSWTVFVTSATLAGGNLGGVVAADKACQSAADKAQLGAQWTAWLSTFDSNVATRLNYVARGVDKAPFGLLDGTLIANDWTELVSGKMHSAIILDENKHALTTTFNVWTGTDGTGLYVNESGATNCNGWSSETGNGWFGQANLLGNAWTKAGSMTCAKASVAHLYCFERTKESTL